MFVYTFIEIDRRVCSKCGKYTCNRDRLAALLRLWKRGVIRGRSLLFPGTWDDRGYCPYRSHVPAIPG